MAVQFYPEYSISFVEKKLYESVENDTRAEWQVYKELLLTLERSNEDWFVWYFNDDLSTNNSKLHSKSYFIILNQRGVILLRVEDGEIEVHDNIYYKKDQNNLKRIKNPFIIAQKQKCLLNGQLFNQFTSLLFVEAIIFPFTATNINSSFDKAEYTFSKYSKEVKKQNIEEFLITILVKKHQYYLDSHQVDFQLLSKDLLSIVKDNIEKYKQKSELFEELDTAKWLNIPDIKLLQALSYNPRIMIEGKSGTGKTTLALAYADQHSHLKGLFVCSSKLSKVKVENKLLNRGINNSVITYYEFIVANSDNLTVKALLKLPKNEFTTITKRAVERYLVNNGERFDYIIVDDAEDLFDKGLEFFLDKLSITGQGLSQGKLFLLYNFKQRLDSKTCDYKILAQLMKDNFVHYHLVDNKRTAFPSEIIDLSLDIDYQLKDVLDELYFRNKQYVSFKEIATKEEFCEQINTYNNEEVVFLVQNSVLKNEKFIKKAFKKERIKNYSKSAIGNCDKLKYTTPIKFKGLESNHVVLIVGQPNKISKYEWYLGVTRAINKVTILYINI